MKKEFIFLRIAGVINLLFMLFHLMFYNMFGWKTGLDCLSNDNRSIMMTYHYVCILIIGFMGILPLTYPGELLHSKMRFTILGTFILFYIIRIITEFTHFGLTSQTSPIIITMCAAPIFLFTYTLIKSEKK